MLSILNGHTQPIARPYQKQIIGQTKTALLEFNKVLVCAPTGCGKTTIMGFLLKDEVERGGKCLVVTDRKTLTRQFAHRTEQDFGIACGIEMAGEEHGGERIICATVQTIINRIANGKFHPKEMTLLCFDEAHLALAKSWQKTYSHFNGSKLVGLTASPRRGDRRDLMEFFDTLVEPVKLDKLINDGWLSPLIIENIPIQIKLQTVHKTGDYDDSEIADSIEPYLAKCADAIMERSDGKCILVFLPLIKTSVQFTKLLNERGLKAEHVDGTMKEKDREKAIKRLEDRKISCLCCSLLLTVGVDIRPVNMICNLRPTRSWTLYVQTIGRGTRLYDPVEHGGGWSKKTECTILDPMWQSDEHSLLQRPSVLLASDDDDAKMIDDAIKKSGGKPTSLMGAVADAKHEREEQLRKRLEAMAFRKSRLVNPMELALSTGNSGLLDYQSLAKWQRDPITEGQRTFLEKVGFDIDSVQDRGHATMILDAITERRDQGLATLKMAKYALSLGLQDAFTRPFKEVSEFLTCYNNNQDFWGGIP